MSATTSSKKLVEEMFWFSKLQQYSIFRFLQQHYWRFRLLTFSVACLLNISLAISIQGPGNDGTRPLYPGGREKGPQYDLINVNPFGKRLWTILLSITIVGYALCAAFQCLTRAPLVAMQIIAERTADSSDEIEVHNGEDNEEGTEEDQELQIENLMEGTDDGIQGHSSYLGNNFFSWLFKHQYLAPAMLKIFSVCFANAALYVVLKTSLDDVYGDVQDWQYFYWISGFSVLVIAVPALNECIKHLDGKAALFFGVLYGISHEPEVVVPVGLLLIAFRGFFHFFACSVLLIDVIFINKRLHNVVQAVVRPVNDILATFVLMVFVVFIFASFGIYEYGQTMLGGVSTNVPLCPNLAFCFLEILDTGLRNGDVVGESFSHLTHEDGMLAWIWRIIFGLAFFLVIGVILFDIVTGTILDTFGSLREERVEREENLRNVSFIAGLERSVCDELGVAFEELNDVQQDKWNYVYLLAHLQIKKEEDYTGAETYISEKLKEGDISWLPELRTWALQQRQQEEVGAKEKTREEFSAFKADMTERFKQMQEGVQHLENNMQAGFQRLEKTMETLRANLSRIDE